MTNLVVNTSETIQTGARAAQQSLLTVSRTSARSSS